MVSGDPGGTICLREGRLAFAESAAVPDIGSRLVNSRRLLPDQWRLADRDSGPDGCAGDLLLARGLIDAAEWDIVVRSAVLDALIALALQLAGDSSAAGTCYVSGQARCAGPALAADTGSAWAYAWQEAGRLAGYGVAPGARPRWRGPGLARHVPGRQAALWGQPGGQAALTELAWRNGLPLYGVMDWVARLIQDGMCILTSGPAGDTPAPDGGPGAGLPQDPRGTDIQWAVPDLDVLRQVLAGLRRLD